MQSGNNGPRRNNVSFPNDPLLQQVTIMALMSNPSIEKRLEETMLMIDGIVNTVRTLRRGMEFFNNSMKEAQRHMLSLPTGTPYQQPNPNNNFNGFNTKPMKDVQQDTPQSP